jgi:DNA-binding IscR family transcriptional regulator
MEGELAMTECCENVSLCTIDSMCTMRENWRKINKMVKNLLSQFTINDMMAPIPAQTSSLEWQDDK